jgi:hypothetical protein
MSRAVEIVVMRLSHGHYLVERDDLRTGGPRKMNDQELRVYLHGRVPHIVPDVIIRQVEHMGRATVRYEVQTWNPD